MHADNLTPHLAALAHHFRAAGVVDKAIDYSMRAGDAAYAVFAYDRAISDLETALELIERREPHSPLRAQVLFGLGSLTCFFRDMLRGVGQLESALELYNKAGDELRVAEIHSLLGLAIGAFSPHMNARRALSHFERAEPVLARTAETHSLGLHYWGLSMTNFDVLKIDEASAASERAIEIFKRLGDERWLVVTGALCQYLMLKGKHAEARALLEKILLEATRLKDPECFRHVVWSCAWYFMLMSEPRRAINIQRSGLKRKDLNTFQRASLLEFLASAEIAAGNLKEATAITHETRVNRAFRSQIAFYGGDWDSASELLQEELDWARNASSAWNELNCLSILMNNLRIKGDFDKAMSFFEQARRMFGPDNQFWELRLRSRAVFLFVDAGQPEMAVEHLQYCRAILAQGENWLGYTGMVRRGEAMIAAANADFGEADRHFASAVELSKQYGLAWDEAETLHYWGRALTVAGEHSRAAGKLDAAIEVYRRHGSGQRWVDRVEADRNTSVPRSGAASDQGTFPPIFRKEGEYWKTAYEGRAASVRERGGMRFIAMLLGRAGENISAIEMFAAISAGAGIVSAQDGLRTASDLGDAGEEFDARALSDYRRRVAELESEIEAAEASHDTGAVARARAEREMLADEIASGTALHGGLRRAASHRERARVNVTRQIKSAIDAIRKVNPQLGRHLAGAIQTGSSCRYAPAAPVKWQL
jgi:tetratricopeptide (TPR) repeat protein